MGNGYDMLIFLHVEYQGADGRDRAILGYLATS